MPAASSSSMSCQRFSYRDPGTFRCQLVDQRHLRAGQDRIDVHLGELRASVGQCPAWDDLHPIEQLGSVDAAVSLDEPDHDVSAAFVPAPALGEHVVGPAPPRGGAEVVTRRMPAA